MTTRRKRRLTHIILLILLIPVLVSLGVHAERTIRWGWILRPVAERDIGDPLRIKQVELEKRIEDLEKRLL